MSTARSPRSKKLLRVIRKKIEISDADLISAGWGNYTFTPVNPKQIEKPIPPSAIHQGRIGNCFFLSALGSAIELNPEYLNRILKINNGKAEVTFYNRKGDVIDETTYVIDATKLDKDGLNNHSHDAIYLLEKAYALHRLMTEPMKDQIKEEKDQGIPESYLNVQISTIGTNTAEKVNVRIFDYVATLEGGYSNNVYAALHLSAHKESLKPPSDAIHKSFAIITNALWQTRNQPTPEALVKSLNNTFNHNTKLIDKFTKEVKALSESDKSRLAESFDQLNTLMKTFGEDHTISLAEARKRLSVLALPAGLQEMKNEIIELMVRQLPTRKRGMGEYNAHQEAVYKHIHENLKTNHLASLGSHEHVHTNAQDKQNIKSRDKGPREEVYKGLLGGHAYQVVDSYERDNLKFVVVRNPWAHYVRDYEYKHKKTHEGVDITVLSAHSKSQLSDFALPKDKPRKLHAIKNSARGTTDEEFEHHYKKQGYFEIELTDVTKRFDTLYLTDIPLPTQHQKKVNFETQVANKENQNVQESVSTTLTMATTLAPDKAAAAKALAVSNIPKLKTNTQLNQKEHPAKPVAEHENTPRIAIDQKIRKAR